MRILKPILTLTTILIVTTLLIIGVNVIDETEIGVKRTLGKIDPIELESGLKIVNPLISSVTKYKKTEYPINLDNLTPKAGDNLSLRDFDVTVYFKPFANNIAEIVSETSLSTGKYTNGNFPAERLVHKVARDAAYTAIANQPKSLLINSNRQQIKKEIFDTVSQEAKNNNWGTITRVIIRSIKVDATIDASIRAEVAEQNKLKKIATRIEVVKKEAFMRIEEAKGIAKANEIINGSLTAEYLQHEQNLAIKAGLEKGANTVVIPANMNSFMLNMNK